LINPEAIIIGGGVGIHLFPLLLPHLREEIDKLLQMYRTPHTYTLDVSTLHASGAIGAAFYFLKTKAN
jgi:predicted NBD/HSP70 family sugar kinase